MGKTVKGKTKTAAKIAKAKAKIARKCKGKCAVILAAVGLAYLFGCSTAESAQPAKANTMSNTFDDCIIIVAAKAKLPIAGTNRVVEAEGGNMPTLELFTQTQSLENSGTDTISPANTQTPTTDIKPQTDLRYNDALSAANVTSKGILETLTQTGMEKVLGLMSSGGSGQVTVEKKDGTQAVVTCENGQCTACTDCSPQ